MEYLKRRQQMPKKKAKRKVYFGKEVQDAIIEYNLSERSSEKNIIYGTRIHKAFDKLAENIINTFKFTYFDDPFVDVKHEVVAFSDLKIQDRIDIIEKLPLSVYNQLVSFLRQIGKYEADILAVGDTYVTIGASFFEGDIFDPNAEA